ncbi:hypothetical protein PS1_023265 [Malus domestica]
MEQLQPNPANLYPLTPLTLLERATVVYRNCPSVAYTTTTYTWSQTHRRCLQLAYSFSSHLDIKTSRPASLHPSPHPTHPAIHSIHPPNFRRRLLLRTSSSSPSLL